MLSRIPLPVDVPLSLDVSPDARVLVVTLVVALLTGAVFGLAPALQGSRADIATTLRGDSAGSGRSRSRLRNALVAAQVAASLLLLTTSGLFVRALARGQAVRPGYDIDHVAIATLDVSLSGYDTVRAQVFYAALRDHMRGLPGVTSVGYTRVVPLTMSNTGYDVAIPGQPALNGGTYANLVDEGYFDVLRQPIVAGRGLLASDNATAPHVAVVSKMFAERYWPGREWTRSNVQARFGDDDHRRRHHDECEVLKARRTPRPVHVSADRAALAIRYEFARADERRCRAAHRADSRRGARARRDAFRRPSP